MTCFNHTHNIVYHIFAIHFLVNLVGVCGNVG